MLIPPDVEDLGTFRGEPYAAGAETERAEMYLQQAVDLFWVLTGLTSVPSGMQFRRVFTNAMCDLALWLMDQDAHREEINAPYSGERIGSYSYQKLARAVKERTDTGVFWLDRLLQALPMLGVGDTGPSISIDSENVFNPQNKSFEELEIESRWDRYANYGTYVLYENG